LIGGALTLAILGVSTAYWLASRHKEQPLVLPESVPTDVHQQLSGYTATHSDGDRRVFTVHAARTLSFKQGGSMVLEDVMVELFGRTGTRHDIMRTGRCDYNSQNHDLSIPGPVHIELNADARETPAAGLKGKQTIYLETSKVFYQHEGSRMTSDEAVRFRIGPASGTSQGMVYGTKDGSLELEKDVVMELHPAAGKASGPPTTLTASRLRYDKLNRQIALSGPVCVTQGDRKVTASSGKVFLNEENRTTRADLEGGVTSAESSIARLVELSGDRAQGDFDPVSATLRHLSVQGNVLGQSRDKGSSSRLAAGKLELSLTGSPAQLQSGEAMESVQLTVESSSTLRPGPSEANRVAREKRVLTAADLKFSFRPGGKSLQDAETVGPGQLVIEATDPKVGRRIITAGRLGMAFDARGDLQSLRGLQPTHIVFEPPRNAPSGTAAQESTADDLWASFDAATHTLADVRQTGNYTYHDGDRNASAQESVYRAATQSVTLTGRPQVWDAESRTRCERLELDLTSGAALGSGKVSATHLETGDAAPDGQLPDPTSVLADHMLAQRRSQVVHYEGNVRAWRGADVVESSSLDVNRKAKRVSAGAQVLTSHLQPASYAPGTAASPQPETRPLTVRADFLDYFDEGSKASYRGHVKLQAEATTMEADKMDVYFSQIGTSQESEVDRAMADGHVVVVQPQRRATAEHGDYFAGPGKIVLTGGPPSLEDVQKGFTTGQRLTLFVHDDRLLVDGGRRSPTLSQHHVAP
jgi:lipopolysaccharide export system protein LptA